MIKSLIEMFPDEIATLRLIEIFDKLLKKYARLLSYEDAFEELQLFFLELISKLKDSSVGNDSDGALVTYISKSIRNQYIFLSQKHKNLKASNFSEISDEQMIYVEQLASSDDITQIDIYFPTVHPLTDREKTILRMHFTEQYSVAEISYMLGISRQAVNQSKNHAIEKIRKGLV